MKLRFAHQLRGIAALAVVIHHFGGIFFSPAVRSIVGVPTRFDPARPGYVDHVMAPGVGGFLYGVFGVAVFFLISGFVIPISLRGLATGPFLVRRWFRIYPVYWCCLLISLSMYVASASYWGTALSDRVSVAYVWRNLFLLHSAKGIPSLDFVCWSLAVEVKFYLVVALVFAGGRNAHRVMATCVGFVVVGTCAAYVATHGLRPETFFAYLVSDMRFLSFMFLGSLFYYVLYGELTSTAAMGYGITIYVMFLAIALFYEGRIFGPLALNYSYALVVFAACYRLRASFGRNRLLDVIADISFPLYLVHSLIGYVGMPILMDLGVPYTGAWMAALVATLAVAWLVHVTVELPANAFGKRVSSRPLRHLSGIWRDSASPPRPSSD